jgi:cytochrome c553
MRFHHALLGTLSLTLANSACRTNPPAPSDAAAAQPPTLTSAAGPRTNVRMGDHGVHGVAMRDAVARADLDTARREAGVLAAWTLEGPVDGATNQRLDAMKAAAARLAAVKDLAAASNELAHVARSCGDCHAVVGGISTPASPPPSDRGDVASRMKRHQWAASRLWEGLVIPSNDAWKAGARVLSDAPLEPELLTPGKSPVPAVGQLAMSVHDLGRRAATVESMVTREGDYGQLMATCSACHGWLGGGPPSSGPGRH